CALSFPSSARRFAKLPRFQARSGCLLAGGRVAGAVGVGGCRLDRAVWKHDSLARSDESIHIEPGLWMCYADTQIAFRRQPHLFDVFPTEEISDAKRQRSTASCDQAVFSVMRKNGRGFAFVLLQDRHRCVFLHWPDLTPLCCSQLSCLVAPQLTLLLLHCQ